MTVILTEAGATQCQAQATATDLWLNRDELQRASGWQLKPEGLCKDEVCVPVPAGADDIVDGEQVNLAGFWRHMGKATATTRSGDVWFLGEAAQARNDALQSLQAPAFSLPDFDGKLHSITDFRRQRVLLITWASW